MERERVVAAQGGDRCAFDRLQARYRPTALLLARAVGLGREAAEDAVQDAFVAAFGALPRLQDPDAFGPWLAAIVRHRARRLAREASLRTGVPLDAVEIAAPGPALSLDDALAGLPDDLRLVLRLHHLEGWGVGEIAALTGLPTTTVKWRLHAGRRLLRHRHPSPEDIP